jgi:hypothetical protein
MITLGVNNITLKCSAGPMKKPHPRMTKTHPKRDFLELNSSRRNRTANLRMNIVRAAQDTGEDSISRHGVKQHRTNS